VKASLLRTILYAAVAECVESTVASTMVCESRGLVLRYTCGTLVGSGLGYIYSRDLVLSTHLTTRPSRRLHSIMNWPTAENDESEMTVRTAEECDRR
jgi:hypothetical protein